MSFDKQQKRMKMIDAEEAINSSLKQTERQLIRFESEMNTKNQGVGFVVFKDT